MKLYSEYKKVITEKIGKIEKAYFTTFNMDIAFVEKYILPPLLGEDIPDNKFSSEDLNLPLMGKKSLDIKFFYDANNLSSFDKNTLIQTYPILIKGGVFHPKVIYLKGEKGTYLFVGSGNLTINGWGRNIEAFEIVDIAQNSNLENQVLNFFDSVFILAGLKQRRTIRDVTFENKIDFIYSFQKEEESTFLENLNIDNSLQIYSPYFSDDLDELFKKEQFENIKQIDIVPDLIENQKIRLKQLPEDERVKFFYCEKLKKNDKAVNHSKIWISDTKYAIGSYNCTKPALYGKNFEASIVKSYEDKDDFLLYKCNEVKPEILDKKIDDEDGILEDEDDRFTSLYKLTADYNDMTLSLDRIDDINEESERYILLPSFSDVVSIKDFKNLLYERRFRIFKALVKNKLFEIQDEQKRILYKGFILEINVKQTNRVTDSAETLDDIFLSFADAKNPTEATILKNRTVDINDNDELTYKRKNRQISINYFSMFTGFKNLNKRFNEIENDDKKLERFCYTSACSLEVTRQIIKTKIESESLFLYLTVLELNKLIREVNKKLDKDKKMEQLEMNLKLSKQDKKFIEEMMK